MFHVAKSSVFLFRQVEKRSISGWWTPGVQGAEVFHVAKSSCWEETLDGTESWMQSGDMCINLIDSREGGYSAIYNRCLPV